MMKIERWACNGLEESISFKHNQKRKSNENICAIQISIFHYHLILFHSSSRAAVTFYGCGARNSIVSSENINISQSNEERFASRWRSVKITRTEKRKDLKWTKWEIKKRSNRFDNFVIDDVNNNNDHNSNNLLDDDHNQSFSNLVLLIARLSQRLSFVSKEYWIKGAKRASGVLGSFRTSDLNHLATITHILQCSRVFSDWNVVQTTTTIA